MTKKDLNLSSRMGHPVPEMYNPADHYVQALAIVPGKEDSCREKMRAITDAYDNSPEGR